MFIEWLVWRERRPGVIAVLKAGIESCLRPSTGPWSLKELALLAKPKDPAHIMVFWSTTSQRTPLNPRIAANSYRTRFGRSGTGATKLTKCDDNLPVASGLAALLFQELSAQAQETLRYKVIGRKSKSMYSSVSNHRADSATDNSHVTKVRRAMSTLVTTWKT